MALPIYLAMTAWEMDHRELPPHCGWMACHFSPYSRGLSNIPGWLPENSLLIVNDRIPAWGHDPNLIAQQLRSICEQLSPRGILLDLQRPYDRETAGIARAICALPCPVAVTQTYAAHCDGGVFLPPLPLGRTLQDYIAPWDGKSLWLETDRAGLTLTLTPGGCERSPGEAQLTEPVFAEEKLHCHYSIRLRDTQAVFSLTRRKEDLLSLAGEAERAGICLAVGLYQELAPVLFVPDGT